MLKKGQKIKLLDYILLDNIFNIDILVNIKNYEIDVSCFGVDSDNKLSDDRYFIFYNQTKSPENAISMNVNNNVTSFSIDIKKIPKNINRLVFCITSDDDLAIKNLDESFISLKQNQNEFERFNFDKNSFLDEKAIIICEVYNKNDIWRMSIVSSGFNGGLSKLLEYFGGEEIKYEEVKEEIKIDKIKLEKSGDNHKIKLKKNLDNRIHINLDWNMKVISKFSGKIDLDLVCMYRFKDGKKGVIQALGKRFGNKDDYPYIYLDKDDRTGSSKDGENLYIFKPELLDFAIICAEIYSGAYNWNQTDAKIILKKENFPDIEVNLSDSNNKNRICVFVSISQNGDNIIINKEEKYFRDLIKTDKNYKFRFRWVEDTK